MPLAHTRRHSQRLYLAFKIRQYVREVILDFRLHCLDCRLCSCSVPFCALETWAGGQVAAARITLVHCWALDKATREPIKDEKHPMAIKHLKRLKNMKKTHFESFDLEEGKWVFTVDQF